MTFNERAARVIPGGAHTYSKGRDQFPANAPQAFVRGKGARVWDLDGREFVDWGMGINNVLIGHAEESIDRAACDALRNGQNFSRPSIREVEAAEQLTQLIDGVEMVKFAKNGSDANTAALRLARAVTGRQTGAVRWRGAVPRDSRLVHRPHGGGRRHSGGSKAPRTAVHLQRSGERGAAVRRTPAGGRRRDSRALSRAEPGAWLSRGAARAVRHARRACSIFDEIVTGFRYGLHGASKLFGVTPDLITIGKGMANGYAVAALAGRRAIMERGGLDHAAARCFLLSTTNGAEQSGLAAAMATVDFYQSHDVIAHLERTGAAAATAIRSAASEAGVQDYLSADGDFGCRPVIVCRDHDGQVSPAHRTLFHQELLARGVFMPWICPSFRHGAAELEQTAEACMQLRRVYRQAIERRSVEGLLDGPAVKPVMRRYN